MTDGDSKGGLNEATLRDRDKEDLGGAGGSSGGGTRAGRGEPSGGGVQGTGGTAGGVPGETLLGAGTGALAGLDGGGIAVEAASLGSADGSLADAAADREAGPERLSSGPRGAEALGGGAGRGETGSGAPADTGDLGGGGGGTGPAGTASPGGEGRA